MIFSILETVSEHEKVQKVIVKGKQEEVVLELENIMTELLIRGFPDDLIMSAAYNALKDSGKLARQ